MKSNSLAKLLILFVLLLPIKGLSQTADHRYTLEQAIQLGLENNKKLQISRLQVNVAETVEKKLKNEKLPEVEVSTGYGIMSNIRQFENGWYNPSTSYEVPREKYNLTLEASIPIYLGGRLTTEEHKAEIETGIAELSVRKDERSLRMEIITAYLHIRHLREQEYLLQSKMHEDSVSIHHIEQLKLNGLVTPNEVLRSQLQLSNHQMVYTELENDVKILEHQVKILLALHPHEEFHAVTDSLLSTPSSVGELDDLVKQAYAKDESLQIYRSEEELRVLDQKMARALQMPQVTASGSYGYSYPNLMFFPPTSFLYRFGLVGVNVKIPITAQFTNKEQKKIARLETEKAKLEVEEREEVLLHQVYAARRKWEEAGQKVRIAQIAIEQAKENYRIVQLKYANQLSLITELIDADNAYLTAQSNMISLKIDEQLKYYQLQHLLGNI